MRENAHLHGFDNWRAFLLLLGPLVHSSPSVRGHRVAWLELMSQASHLFRMEAFFAIAGFMMIHAGCVSRPGWLAGRLCQLLLPAATAWLLLNLPAIAFARWWTGEPLSMADPIHLWFLLDLAACTALMCWLDARDLLPAPGPRWPLWPGLGLAAACAARLILYKLRGDNALANIATGLPYYFCFLFAGAAVARTPAAIGWLRRTRCWWIGLPMLGATLWLFASHLSVMVDRVPGEHHPLFHLGYQLVAVVCAVGMTITVLATALRVHSERSRLRRLSRSSYSVYLVHVAPALVFGALFADLSLAVPVRFAAVVALSFGISWAVHRLVVERSPLAAFLLNGRALPRVHPLRTAWARVRAVGGRVESPFAATGPRWQRVA